MLSANMICGQHGKCSPLAAPSVVTNDTFKIFKQKFGMKSQNADRHPILQTNQLAKPKGNNMLQTTQKTRETYGAIGTQCSSPNHLALTSGFQKPYPPSKGFRKYIIKRQTLSSITTPKEVSPMSKSSSPQGMVFSSELPNCRTVTLGMTHLGATFSMTQIILHFVWTRLSQVICLNL